MYSVLFQVYLSKQVDIGSIEWNQILILIELRQNRVLVIKCC